MSDVRDLNYQAIDEMIDAGAFEPKELLESLIQSMEAKKVNDHLAYICRVHEMDIPCGKELSEYEDRS